MFGLPLNSPLQCTPIVQLNKQKEYSKKGRPHTTRFRACDALLLPPPPRGNRRPSSRFEHVEKILRDYALSQENTIARN